MEQILCAHRGKSGDQGLWWTSYNGTTWRGDTEFSNGAQSSSAPAIAADANGVIYCVHRGAGNHDLWWSTFDPVTERWSADTKFTNGNQTNEAPALVLLGTTLYCVHRGASSASLWWCTFDGSTWTADTEFKHGNATSAGPAVANLNGTLYCVHRGDHDQDLWWATFDGTNWSEDTKFNQGNQTFRGPALYADDAANTIYCVHRGRGEVLTTNGESLWWCQWLGSNWSADQEFKHGNKTADAPALVHYNSLLRCVHRGITNVVVGGNDELFMTDFDGSNWDADVRFASGNSSADGVGLAKVNFP